MVDLGRQDTDWVGGNNKERLDAILPPDGLILLKKTQNLMKSARILLTILAGLCEKIFFRLKIDEIRPNILRRNHEIAEVMMCIL